jgi:hypothetical protein
MIRHTPRKRGIQYAAPPVVDNDSLGVLDRPHSRAMTTEVKTAQVLEDANND